MAPQQSGPKPPASGRRSAPGRPPPPAHAHSGRSGEHPHASRAGPKLEAALAQFGLGRAVRGSQVVDIGASTGGFTEVLLGQGARAVTAVDVGESQLHTRLRQDPRVKSHERTDWKTLPLRELPGPFDFFTVDVSFVAARSMLRGLAFRLRPGAEGVVLVKPQFELPRRPLAELASPAVRARALKVFQAKAEILGFEVRGQLDSPVPGRSGTVELLVHLRFRGRPAQLPPPPGSDAVASASRAGAGVTARAAGASRVHRRVRARRESVGHAAKYHWFAVVAPGLEDVARREVEALPGATGVTTVAGGVELAGPLALGMAANLHLRVVSRVLLRLGTVRAREFSKLRRLLGKLDFASFVPPERAVRVTASATRCRLYHTKAIAETVLLAMSDCLGVKLKAAEGPGPSDEERPEPAGENEATAAATRVLVRGESVEDAGAAATRVLVRGENDVWTVSVDSSGELLHRRGWRLAAGRAPLRETLASGVLALAGYDPQRPLIDVMCGAGTFVIEAAALAADRAPGLHRSFAFERWPAFAGAPWTELREQATSAQKPEPPAAIFGWDRDPRVLSHARENAARAGFATSITFDQAAVGAWTVPAGLPPGLVVVNPPYGKRMATTAAARALARHLGQALRASFGGWRLAVLLPDPSWTRVLGLRKATLHPLINGGLRIHLALAELPTPPT